MVQLMLRRVPCPVIGTFVQVSVIGAPSNLGQPMPGVAAGPSELRAAGLADVVVGAGWRHHDCGDAIYPQDSTRQIESIGAGSLDLANAVYDRAAHGDFVLTIGGGQWTWTAHPALLLRSVLDR